MSETQTAYMTQTRNTLDNMLREFTSDELKDIMLSLLEARQRAQQRVSDQAVEFIFNSKGILKHINEKHGRTRKEAHSGV